MKVLASAYACAPAWGSEPGAGWYWVRSMAEHNDVWLITPTQWARRVEPYLKKYPDVAGRLHLVPVDIPEWTRGFRAAKRDRHLLHAYLWQRAAARAGKKLHREIGFDVAHHITWTVNWLPAGVSRIPGLPFVWGPVSGMTGTPRSLYRWLGWRGRIQESVRETLLPIARRAFGSSPVRSAALVLAQNHEVGRWAREHTNNPVVVEPVVCVPMFRLPPATERADAEGRQKKAVFGARFAAWKGLRIAIAALSRPEAAEWTLDVYGKGPEERPARRLARKLGVESRVRFLGYVPIKELESAISKADAFVHPSMHDAPPFAVAEALAMGTPVICLDYGGPAALVGKGQGVLVSTKDDIVAGMAAALASVPARFPPTPRWSPRRLPDFLDDCYQKAIGNAGPPYEFG